MDERIKRLQDLQFAQCRAVGALKGHVAFMLVCHERGVVNERQWRMLRQYHDDAEQASQAMLDHTLQVVEVMQ